jgi:hypothetical protein
MLNSISAFEYVTILVSIILGLGITFILSSFSDLLFHYAEVRFYWPHTIWIFFLLFLHVQDWVITYQLKDKAIWTLPSVLFVLLYPSVLFMCARMLMPDEDKEKKKDLKQFYEKEYPIIFKIFSAAILLSIFFNLILLNQDLISQLPLLIFLLTIIVIAFKKINSHTVHQLLAIVISAGVVISVFLEKNNWVIR